MNQQGHDTPLQALVSAQEDTATSSTWLAELAADDAPRRFAIVYEYPHDDGEVAAYGLAFEDHADVSAVDSSFYTRSASAEGALATYRHMSDDEHTAIHLVWLDAEASMGVAS